MSEWNRATSVLRGIIYLLISEYEKLVCHLLKPYNKARNRFFEDPNVSSGLWENLFETLKDKSLLTVCLIVDGLDECDDDIFQLLEWIVYKDALLEPSVKWLATCRNKPQIKELQEANNLPHKVEN